MELPQPLSASERATRSCFVGNIPYEATEDALKEIFQQAGPVVSFRLVYDRETGKPKGYGFCEFQDTETAQSALRNLNNTDFNGRPLRVGVAAGETNKDEMQGMQQALGGPILESPYGDAVETEKAPEAISKAVASLPPEQMFELMKQMKLCIQNNPTEARNMLLQNPQLAYALLQAQIVMKIVDPQVAMAMLHRDSSQVPPTGSSAPVTAPTSQPPMQATQPQPVMQMTDASMAGQSPRMSSAMAGLGIPQQMMGGPSPMMGGPLARLTHPAPMGGMRPMGGGPLPDMSMPQFPPQQGMPGPRQQGPPRQEFRDPRMMAGDSRGMPPGPAPRPAGPPVSIPSGMPGQAPTSMAGLGPLLRGPLPSLSSMGGLPNLAGLSGLAGGLAAGGGISSQDQEKAELPSRTPWGVPGKQAALIMQVLQLTDQQIAMLPPDQRQSILILKEQISKTA